MKTKNSLIKLLSLQLTILFIVIALAGGYIIIKNTIDTSNKEKENLRVRIINQKKELLQSQMKKVFEYIRIQESKTIRLAKNELLHETYLLHSTILNIYNSMQKKDIPVNNITSILIETIKNFNQSAHQKFFITTMEGISVYNPEYPSLSGTSTLHLRDAHQTRVTNEEIEMVKLSDEGFLSTFWGNKPPFRQKVTFIKSLAPLPWYITSSIYLDDFKKSIQKSMFEHLSKLRFGSYEENYFFVNTLDGLQVVSNGKVYDPRPNIWNFKDVNGLKVVQQNSIIAQTYPDGNFNYYTWKKLDGSLSEKMAFIKLVPHWDMFIGAGVSLDIIEETLKKEEENLDRFLKNRIFSIIAFLGVALLSVTFLMLYLTKRIKNNISKFTLSFEKATKENENISDKDMHFKEFQIIAKDANRLINQLKEQQQETYHKASHDYLTNLPNRMLLIDRLNLAITQAKRDNLKVAVIFFDLDHFKNVNDTLGHDMGDKLLKDIADRLRKVIRSSDTLARIGGDEFIFVLPSIEKTNTINECVERVLSLIHKPFKLNGRNIQVGASLGISVFPEDGETSNPLLKNADIAMYEAKQSGRNNFKYFNKSMDIKIHETLQLQSDIKKAIKHDEFELYYQPKVDLRSGMVVGVEALIRWLHPKKGLIFPDSFINLAEETGLIVPLGEWILRESCKQYNRWRQKGYTLMMAINISVKQIENDSFARILKTILEEENIPFGHIELELTESFAAHKEENIKALKNLKNLGIRLAIDDFGTGYSSLSYLHHLPINTLKIDRTFITNLKENSDKKALVEVIIQTAKILKLQTVAEGVENLEEVEILKGLGCDLYQGYYFSKPQPASSVEKLF